MANKNCEKLHFMAPNIYCAGAGTAADCDKTTGTISSQLELHRLNTGRQVRWCTVLYCILYCTVLAGAGGGRPEDGEADALQIPGPHRHLPHQAITKNMEFWIFRPVHFPEPRGNCPAYSCENKYREADSVPQEEILEDL